MSLLSIFFLCVFIVFLYPAGKGLWKYYQDYLEREMLREQEQILLREQEERERKEWERKKEVEKIKQVVIEEKSKKRIVIQHENKIKTPEPMFIASDPSVLPEALVDPFMLFMEGNQERSIKSNEKVIQKRKTDYKRVVDLKAKEDDKETELSLEIKFDKKIKPEKEKKELDSQMMNFYKK
jgi:hypothetical protein